MKKRLLSFFILPSILLTSCSFLFSTKSVEKEINVYDIDKLDKDGNLSSGYQTTLKTRFISGRDYIPYLTLNQYASLYEPHLAEGMESKVEKVSFGSIWTVSKGEDVYFAAQINYLYDQIVLAGNLESAFADDDDPRDLKALNYGMKNTSDGKFLGDKTYATFSFADYSISHFTYNNEHYYPLGLLDITFSDSSSIYFTYNYKHIISTRDVDNYRSTLYIEDGYQYTFDSQMESYSSLGIMPTYLAEYNANLFLYLMDHFYGLKDTKGIKSMVSYYKNKGVYTGFFSSFSSLRGQAYSDALTILDDNHTVLYSTNSTWGENVYDVKYADGVKSRSVTRNTLKGLRSAMYEQYQRQLAKNGDVIYSQDGKTAMFSFDSFVFGTTEQVFNEDESIKQDARYYDTFINLIAVLQSIKNKGGVDNVILDISINGGGVIGVMMKLLALISKDNNGGISFYDDTTTQVGIYGAQIDINADEKYDQDDCFGNDFNFYILTSDCSFSCGNAFPCLAQINKTAKIIGQKSGGGECAVAIHYLPNSQYVYHSSNLHLGYFDEGTNTFTGFEKGATPDIEIQIGNSFYNIEYLNTAIKSAQ